MAELARIDRALPSAVPTRKRVLARLEKLKTERSSWDAHIKDICDHFLPRRPRYLSGKKNDGGKRNDKILNTTPLLARRTLAAGMASSISSRARPWFTLGIGNPRLAALGSVRRYLGDYQDLLRELIAKSNIYNCLQQAYEDLGPIGTAVLIVDEDPEDVLRGHVLAPGQYCLAQDSRGFINTVFEEPAFTVEQLVDKFGLKSCSRRVQELFKRDQLDEWIDVVHVLEPNRRPLVGRKDWQGMPYLSLWLEKGASDEDGDRGFLQLGGYQTWPAMCPRWSTSAEDIYGSGPGMEALADAKQLMFYEKQKAAAMALLVKPTMVGPSALASRLANLLPGGFTPNDLAGSKFEPAFLVQWQAVQAATSECMRFEGRIDAAFFKDLFLMMAGADRAQPITAEEVRAKQEEKLLQIGPVVERLDDELFDPLVIRASNIAAIRGLVPPAPPELEGAPLKIEYSNIVSQALKLLGTVAIERYVKFVGGMLLPIDPNAADKVQTDRTADAYGSAVGVPAAIVPSDDEIAKKRQARAQAQAQAQAMQAGQMAAESARALSQSDMGGDNALTQLAGAYGSQMPGGGQ